MSQPINDEGVNVRQADDIDAERLAAFIDGRVHGDERDIIIETLAKSDEDAGIVMDAIAATAVSNRLDQGEMVKVKGQSKQSFVRAGWVSAGLALAAAAAIVIVLKPGATGVGEHASEGAEAFARRFAQPSPLPAQWNSAPWSGTRGNTVNPNDSALYVRLGAFVLDLEVSLRAGDRATATRNAERISALLESVPGGGAAGSLYRQLARPDTNPDPAEISRARQGLRELPHQELIELGAWLEAARIAASRHDIKWFTAAENQKRLDELVANEKGTTLAASAARVVRESTVAKSPDWSALEEELTLLLGSW